MQCNFRWKPASVRKQIKGHADSCCYTITFEGSYERFGEAICIPIYIKMYHKGNDFPDIISYSNDAQLIKLN